MFVHVSLITFIIWQRCDSQAHTSKVIGAQIAHIMFNKSFSQSFSRLCRVSGVLLKCNRNYSENINKDVIYTQFKEKDNGIAVIGLNRPKQRNALSMNLVKELCQILDNVAVDTSVRVLILRSLVPGVFCVGADLKERITMTQRQVSIFVTELRHFMTRIHYLSVPVIAALDGITLGGGLELALASDIRVASSATKLGLVETKLAIIPGAGGTQRLPRLINPAIAKELIYTARVFNGKEAKDLGIVNHAVEQNDNNDAAYLKSLEIAREILPNGPVAVKMAKAAINKGLEVNLPSGLIEEEACYYKVIPTEDRIEGLTAFQEKRPAKYIGK